MVGRPRYRERMAIQRATVISAVDPDGQDRVQVRLVTGRDLWAARVFPLAAFTAHDPAEGAEVWVGFEDDDPERPVVLGLAQRPARRDALARDLEALGDAWDRGHFAGTADAEGGETANPYR